MKSFPFLLPCSLALAACLVQTLRAAESTNGLVRVAAAQAARRLVDFRLTNATEVLAAVETHLAALEVIIAKAGQEKCDALVLPEDTMGLLNWIGMNEPLTKEVLPAAVQRMITRLGGAAARHRMYLVVCSDFVEDGGATYNTAFLLGRDGSEIGRYHKVCPTWGESGARARGKSFPVFPTPDLGTAGMLICYDLVVPETARALALQGADIIFFPTMGGAAIGDDDIGEQALRVRAAENFIWLIVAHRGQGAMIISPQGKIIARAEGPDGLAIADIDPHGSRGGGDSMNWQRDMRARLFRERNPEAFGILTEPSPPILEKVPIDITPQAAGQIMARGLTLGEEEFKQAQQLLRSGQTNEAAAAFERLRREYRGSWIDRVSRERLEKLGPVVTTPTNSPTGSSGKKGNHTAVDLLQFWPQWRGPLANGVAPFADPPTVWSETNHVRWKVPLPGKGHSTPIVFGDRVFLTAAVPVGPAEKPVHDNAPGTHDNVSVTHRHQFILVAFNRRDGQIAWSKILREEFPHEGGHETGSLASNSPTTDGESLYVCFGSRGLYCLDLNGEIKWQKDLGKMQTLHAHGEGSSPVIHGDTLIVCWDHEGDSALYALDKRTGKERWKIQRDEKTSWSTPLVIEHEGRQQVVISATKRVRSYDLATGTLLWECAGLSRNVVSSPVAGHGMVFAGNSYDWQAMLAIRLAGAKGDITDTDRVAWKLNRLTPYVSSPLLYEDTLYFLRHNQNILSRLDPVTGEPRGEPLRLEGIRDFIFASPLGAAGRIYVTSRDGATVVLRHDRENATLAVNRLDEVFSASPAVADKELYLRGEKFLYCIAE